MEFQLRQIHLQFDRLETDIEVFEARITGEYPAIAVGPTYDVAGLDAEEGFSLSFEDAVAIGRRLQHVMPDDSSDGDLSY